MAKKARGAETQEHLDDEMLAKPERTMRAAMPTEAPDGPEATVARVAPAAAVLVMECSVQVK